MTLETSRQNPPWDRVISILPAQHISIRINTPHLNIFFNVRLHPCNRLRIDDINGSAIQSMLNFTNATKMLLRHLGKKSRIICGTVIFHAWIYCVEKIERESEREEERRDCITSTVTVIDVHNYNLCAQARINLLSWIHKIRPCRSSDT